MPSLPYLQVRRQGDETFARFVDLDRLDEYNSDASGEELDRLAQDAPHTRPIERFGDIVVHPILGGLHHRYARI